MKLNRRAQQIIEYLLVVVAGTMIVLAMSGRGGDVARQSLNKAVDYIYEDYRWVVGDWSECAVTCGSCEQIRTVECQTDGGNPAAEEKCLEKSSRPETSFSPTLPPCITYAWQEGGWSGCNVPCGQGTETQTVVCMSSQGNPSPGMCSGPPPESTRNCTGANTCHWEMTAQSPCQQACGSSSYTRTYLCQTNVGVFVSEQYCQNTVGPMPQTVIGCTDYSGCMCTGNMAENSSECPQAQDNLTAMIPWSLGDCSNAAVKCQARCDSGYRLENNACVMNQCLNQIANSNACPGATENLQMSMNWTLSASCTGAKCQAQCLPGYYICNSGSNCCQYQCQGQQQAGTTVCSGSDQNLTSNQPWTYVDAGACVAGTKCQAQCPADHEVLGLGTGCVPRCGNASCDNGEGGRPNYGETCSSCPYDCSNLCYCTTVSIFAGNFAGAHDHWNEYWSIVGAMQSCGLYDFAQMMTIWNNNDSYAIYVLNSVRGGYFIVNGVNMGHYLGILHGSDRISFYNASGFVFMVGRQWVPIEIRRY